jgi:hypothetical protein
VTTISFSRKLILRPRSRVQALKAALGFLSRLANPGGLRSTFERILVPLIETLQAGACMRRLDLQRLTREVMSRMASDLHTSLDWVAVPHFNTEHPHVHFALHRRRCQRRGIQAGSGLRPKWSPSRGATFRHRTTWLPDRAGRYSPAPPSSPPTALHTAGPVDRGANSQAGRSPPPPNRRR